METGKVDSWESNLHSQRGLLLLAETNFGVYFSQAKLMVENKRAWKFDKLVLTRTQPKVFRKRQPTKNFLFLI